METFSFENSLTIAISFCSRQFSFCTRFITFFELKILNWILIFILMLFWKLINLFLLGGSYLYRLKLKCRFSDFTYVVHLEAINCLLVLLSVQLFSQTPAEYSTVYRIVMHEEQAAHASVIVCTLLNNFTEQSHAPPGLLNNNLGSSIVLSIAGNSHFYINLFLTTKNTICKIYLSNSNKRKFEQKLILKCNCTNQQQKNKICKKTTKQ